MISLHFHPNPKHRHMADSPHYGRMAGYLTVLVGTLVKGLVWSFGNDTQILDDVLHFPRKHRTCGDWARRREHRLRRRQVSGPAGPGEDRRGKPPARWTVCLRPNGSSDCPESSEE